MLLGNARLLASLPLAVPFPVKCANSECLILRVQSIACTKGFGSPRKSLSKLLIKLVPGVGLEGKEAIENKQFADSEESKKR
jgi:hypothetical protein